MTKHPIAPTPRAPFSLRTYRAATSFLKPVANYALKQRLKAGKEDAARIGERRGVASTPRPEAPLLWVHGASVGESLSILPLIDRLSSQMPKVRFLVTTGTVTSAELMAERLPATAIHQYAPIDQPDFVRAFFDHWQPDAGLFVESELWPVLIGEAQSRAIPLAIVNGRLSPKSFRGWSRRPRTARALLDAFQVILGQDEGNAERLGLLAGRDVTMPGNLKRAAPPLPSDDEAIATLQKSVGDRCVWLAASTHPGEEEFILDVHRQLTADLPGLLTILAPRHPNRGDEVATLIANAGLPLTRRSEGMLPSEDTAVYLADTLGELGIFYRLSNVAFIGGSLTPVGGHNPMEPARLGSAIVTGPNVFNFQETFQSMRKAGALALVRNERDLSASLLRLLTDARTRETMSSRALQWSEEGAEQVLTETITALSAIFPPVFEAPTSPPT